MSRSGASAAGQKGTKLFCRAWHFARSAALNASVYLGDSLSFALYAMASQPEIFLGRIQGEADGLFANGDPEESDYDLSAIDVTHRFIMEVQRMYPVAAMCIRKVMNTSIVGDCELPVGPGSLSRRQPRTSWKRSSRTRTSLI